MNLDSFKKEKKIKIIKSPNRGNNKIYKTPPKPKPIAYQKKFMKVDFSL